MTTDTATPQIAYTVAGTGPYDVPWPYDGGDLTVAVVTHRAALPLAAGADWAVLPASGPAGAIVLTAAAALAHAGRRIVIARRTALEQGWQGQSGREIGLMANIDRITRGLQDATTMARGALRVASGEADPLVLTDGCLPVWQGNRLIDGPVAADVAAGVPAAIDAANRAAASAALFADLSVTATTVPPSQPASGGYDPVANVLTLNIPQGDPGTGLGAMPSGRVVGRVAAGTGVAEYLTPAQVQAVAGLVPQSGATDAGAGRVLTAGAFGLGATGAGPLLADLDATNTPAGLYRYSAATTGTKPAGVSADGSVVVMRGRDATSLVQTLYSGDGVTVWSRAAVSGVWSDWIYSLSYFDRATLPDAVAGTGNGLMDAEQTAAAITAQTALKAWGNCNFDGTPAIRAAFNVSSLNKTATGRCGVTFLTPFPTADYSLVALAGPSGAPDLSIISQTVDGFIVTSSRYALGSSDPAYFNFAVFA